MKSTKKKNKESLTALVPVLLPFNPEEILQAANQFFQRPIEFVFLHVIDIRLKDSLNMLDAKSAEGNFTKLKSNAESYLKELNLDENTQLLVVEGVPLIEIIKVSKDLKVDLIMMKSKSTQRQKKIEDLLFGSTAEKVIRASSIPVFCLP